MCGRMVLPWQLNVTEGFSSDLSDGNSSIGTNLYNLPPSGVPVTNPTDDDQPSPEGLAFEWVSRILAVAAEMVLPGLAGQWLDRRWGTNFLVLIGFALGISLGIWHLLMMTSAGARKPTDSSKIKNTPDNDKK